MSIPVEKSKEIKNFAKFIPNELLFKFLILGDYGVGKTSIVKRFVEGTFLTNYKITLGAEFALKRINWNETTRINLQLWDIAGHERFGYLTRVYYKYSVAAAIIFDLSRSETFSSVEKWLLDLQSKVTLANGKNLPVVLLANKSDVAISNIPNEEINALCKKYGVVSWFLTSAKENTNIDKAIQLLLEKVMENKLNNLEASSDNIDLNKQIVENNARLDCCG